MDSFVDHQLLAYIRHYNDFVATTALTIGNFVLTLDTLRL